MSNNKKTLLSESQIRQFMKLAKLEPLTPGFVNGLTEVGAPPPAPGKKNPFEKAPEEKKEEELDEGEEEEIEESHGRGRDEGAAGYGQPDQNTRMTETTYRDEDEELEVELGTTEDELGAEDEFADEEGGELDDLDAMAPEEEVGTEDQMVSVDDFLDALGDALRSAVSEVTGEETEVDVVDDEEGAPEGEELEVGAEEEVEPPGGDLEMGAEEEELMEGLLDAAGVQLVDTSALVEKITKRVAARIVKEALKAKK